MSIVHAFILRAGQKLSRDHALRKTGIQPWGKGLTSFGLTDMSSELVSCSCEALHGSLLPAFVGVKIIFEQ